MGFMSSLRRASGPGAFLGLAAGLLAAAGTAWGQISLVQVTNCGPASFPGNCTIAATGSGNLIVVAWQASPGDPSITISNITDNAGNTYAQAGSSRAVDNSLGFVTDIWYAKNSIAGGTSIRITPSAATSNTGVVIWEFAGVDRTAPLGTAAVLSDQPGSLTPQGGTVTTTGSSVVISHALVAATITGIAPGNPFTNASNLKANGWAYLIAPNPGSYTSQWTQNTAGEYCSSTVWFKAASASVSPASACDITGDGVVDSSDVNSLVSMVLGTTACTANIQGPGVCNVTTVQRVVNASLPGGQCVTGSGVASTVSGTISPGSTASGSIVSLTGATTASVSADASGNFTFSGLADGTYTITPSKSGYSFSPPSQQVVVNGANVTGVAFSITQNPPTPALSTLSCTPTTFNAAGTAVCTVGLTAAALTGGFAVTLSDNSSFVTVPGSVTVAANALTATFNATISAVTSTQTVTITAVAGGVTRTFALTLNPPAAIQHSVTISWGASPSSGVTGYNVYRGTTSGGPYTKINSSNIAGLSFVDNTVLSGVTYYYVGTAVNSTTGLESGFSNQAQAVIPTP
jgi:hypothetical protein